MLHGLQIPSTAQVHAQLTEAPRREMRVRVVEPRHHKVSAEIDDLGLLLLELQDVVVGTDANNLPCTHRDCLCPSRCGLGVNIAIDEDRIGRFRVVGCRCRRSEHNVGQRGENQDYEPE